MLPPAPPRFSTTKGVPNLACRFCATIRPTRSAEPPAENGTTTVTCRCGQVSCACAAVALARPAASAAANRAFIPALPFRHVRSRYDRTTRTFFTGPTENRTINRGRGANGLPREPETHQLDRPIGPAPGGRPPGPRPRPLRWGYRLSSPAAYARGPLEPCSRQDRLGRCRGGTPPAGRGSSVDGGGHPGHSAGGFSRGPDRKA